MPLPAPDETGLAPRLHPGIFPGAHTETIAPPNNGLLHGLCKQAVRRLQDIIWQCRWKKSRQCSPLKALSTQPSISMSALPKKLHFQLLICLPMEPLSAASSVFAVVSVAIELAKGINKLVLFCKALQDAPYGLKVLVEDLEVLGELLEQVQAVSLDLREGDKYIERAVYRCSVTVRKLEEVIWKPSIDLRSEKPGKRFRGRFKVVLAQSQIDALRREIERAKSHLQIAQINALIQLSQCHYSSQKQLFQDVNKSTQEGISKVLYEQREFLDTMQLLQQENSDIQGSLSIQITTGTTSGSHRETNSPLKCALNHETVAIHDMNLITRVLAVQKRIKSRRTTRITQNKARSTDEDHSDYVLYPRPFLQRLGFAYGLLVQTRSTSWQFTLHPFHVIKETSPIFEFCRSGNLEAIQTLLGLGEASVRDRDPNGRTPLWIAAHSLQPAVAELLLQEGADPHIYDWHRKCPPIAAIQESTSVDVNKKLSLLSIFQIYSPDGHDTLEVWSSVGKLLLSYRPQRIMAMDLMSRKQASHKLLQQVSHLLPRDDEHWIKILFGMMQLFYDADIIRWTLGQIQGMIPQTEENSAVHRALAMKLFITDPVAASTVVKKTADLHSFWGRMYSGVPPGTPTSIALYQPKVFFAWVRVLKGVGVDLDEFVTEELWHDASVLKVEGWEVDSLREVFDLQEEESIAGGESVFLKCERCGKHEGSSWLKLDLAWRRSLRNIRLRWRTEHAMVERDIKDIQSTIQELTTEEIIPPNEISGTCFDETENLPNAVVCSDECQDGVCLGWEFENWSPATVSLANDLQCSDETRKNMPSSPINAENFDEDSLECPTTSMPGAFSD